MLSYDYYIESLNLVGRERVDPLLELLFSLCGQPGVLGAQCVIVFLGMAWILSRLGFPRGRVLSGTTTFLLALLFILGADSVAFRWHWFPATAAALLMSIQCRQLKAYALCIGLLSLFIYTAGSLAPLGCLFLFVVLYFESVDDEDLESAKSRRLHSLILILGFVVAVLVLPQYPMPDYPGGARLAPISSFTLNGTPMVGPYLQPMPLLFSEYLDVFLPYLVRTLSIFALLYLCLRIDSSSADEDRIGDGLFRSGFFLILLFHTELLPFLELRGALPFPVFTRLVPGLALSPLPWSVTPFILFFCVLVWTRCAFRLQVLATALGILLLTAFSLIMPGVAIVASAEYENSSFAQVESSKWGASRFLLKKRGDWAKKQRRFDTLRRLKKGTDYSVKVQASPNNEEAFLAVDGDVATRWRTAGPQQNGDYFDLAFDAPTNVLRVVLSVKGVPSDFPRGLAVRATLADGSEREVFREQDWLGPVKWTDSGLPYFGPQSEVVLDLPEELAVTALRFTQLQSEDVFDWAISEVKLYRYSD